ncbi:MAG: DUF2793 domain-containing protein [Pseudomonadota bacterium]
MSSTVRLGLPYLAAGQASKHITHNEALKALDALVQIAVISASVATSPPSPTEGDRYLVPVGGTGDFADKDGQLASYADGAWSFYTPLAGWVVWVVDSARFTVFDGTNWLELATTSPSLLGINAAADSTNRLAVASDAVLVTAETSNVQMKLNKTSSGDTGTLLFQTGWAGRAEMGLAGNDDFSIKVDGGGSWPTALAVSRATGEVAVGHTAPTCSLHVAGPARIGQYTVATLPNASTIGAGGMAYVSDHNSAPALAVSDGSAWKFAPLAS